MLSVPEQLKNILKNDRFPMSDTSVPKDLEITFDGMLPIHADQVVDDSFSLTESIIADDDIRFGTCRASQIKFKLASVPEELKGREFTINQLIGGEYVIPLGKYKVQSAKLQDDLIFKEVIAYDKLKDTDVDVSSWYNGLFPTGNETYTLKQFRSSLLAYLGIEEVSQTLPNDDMVVEKTIDPTQISGRIVLEATVELNGAFGNINRYGKFRRIVLQPAYGLYPSETLYPSENLYPVAEMDTSYVSNAIIDENINKAMYKSVRFEEYTVKEIDKLQMRAEENDIGSIVGSGTNTYVIEGNFLVFGKSASELERIATNIYGYIAKRPYRPYETENIGLPYVEVGDNLEYATDDVVHGYVLHRTLTGIQSLWDEIEAPGSEEREQNFGVNKEIIQLQGKVTRIKKDVEGVSIEVEDLEQDTASKFTQTAQSISTEVTRATDSEGALDSKIVQTAQSISAEVTRAKKAEGTLSGGIDVLAGQVVLKVDTNGNIGYIDLMGDPDTGLTSIDIKADNISLEGLITANDNFKILEDGSIEAKNGRFSGRIDGAEIYSGGSLTVSAWDTYTYGEEFNEVILENGVLACVRTAYTQSGGVYTKSATMNYSTLNIPNVNADNVGSSSDPTINGYFKNLYVDGTKFSPIVDKNINKLYSQSNQCQYYAELNNYREFIPNTSSSSYKFSIGNSNYPWTNGYFTNLYVNGKSVESIDETSVTKIYVPSSTTYYATLNGSRQFIPSMNMSSYPFSLGSSSYPWANGHINDLTSTTIYTTTLRHGRGSLGLFGKPPTTKKTIKKLGSTHLLADTHNKVNEIITVLEAYGLISI